MSGSNESYEQFLERVFLATAAEKDENTCDQCDDKLIGDELSQHTSLTLSPHVYPEEKIIHSTKNKDKELENEALHNHNNNNNLYKTHDYTNIPFPESDTHITPTTNNKPFNHQYTDDEETSTCSSSTTQNNSVSQVDLNTIYDDQDNDTLSRTPSYQYVERTNTKNPIQRNLMSETQFQNTLQAVKMSSITDKTREKGEWAFRIFREFYETRILKRKNSHNQISQLEQNEETPKTQNNNTYRVTNNEILIYLQFNLSKEDFDEFIISCSKIKQYSYKTISSVIVEGFYSYIKHQFDIIFSYEFKRHIQFTLRGLRRVNEEDVNKITPLKPQEFYKIRYQLSNVGYFENIIKQMALLYFLNNRGLRIDSLREVKMKHVKINKINYEPTVEGENNSNHHLKMFEISINIKKDKILGNNFTQTLYGNTSLHDDSNCILLIYLYMVKNFFNNSSLKNLLFEEEIEWKENIAEEYLFTRSDGYQITNQSIEHLMKHWINIAGINYRLTPRSFRTGVVNRHFITSMVCNKRFYAPQDEIEIFHFMGLETYKIVGVL
jgi:hypothetical protein